VCKESQSQEFLKIAERVAEVVTGCDEIVDQVNRLADKILGWSPKEERDYQGSKYREYLITEAAVYLAVLKLAARFIRSG